MEDMEIEDGGKTGNKRRWVKLVKRGGKKRTRKQRSNLGVTWGFDERRDERMKEKGKGDLKLGKRIKQGMEESRKEG